MDLLMILDVLFMVMYVGKENARTKDGILRKNLPRA